MAYQQVILFNVIPFSKRPKDHYTVIWKFNPGIDVEQVSEEQPWTNSKPQYFGSHEVLGVLQAQDDSLLPGHQEQGDFSEHQQPVPNYPSSPNFILEKPALTYKPHSDIILL